MSVVRTCKIHLSFCFIFVYLCCCFVTFFVVFCKARRYDKRFVAVRSFIHSFTRSFTLLKSPLILWLPTKVWTRMIVDDENKCWLPAWPAVTGWLGRSVGCFCVSVGWLLYSFESSFVAFVGGWWLRGQAVVWLFTLGYVMSLADVIVICCLLYCGSKNVIITQPNVVNGVEYEEDIVFLPLERSWQVL